MFTMYNPMRALYNNSEFEYQQITNKQSSQSFQVRLVSGEWPNDSNLITLVDNRFQSTNKRHFDGLVKDVGSNEKVVTVYTD